MPQDDSEFESFKKTLADTFQEKLPTSISKEDRKVLADAIRNAERETRITMFLSTEEQSEAFAVAYEKTTGGHSLLPPQIDNLTLEVLYLQSLL